MSALFTRADYLALPEGYPAQLIEGHLVKESVPVYGHQRIVLAICDAVRDAAPYAGVLPSPVEVGIDELNVFHPDVAVFRSPVPDGECGTHMPILVFEVASPSTRRRDRGFKRRRYIGAGVLEVWLVDPMDQTIALYRADGASTEAVGTQVARSTVLRNFSLRPADLFS